MKKVLTAVMICLFYSNVFGAASLEVLDATYPTGINGKDKAYVVNSVDGIVAGEADEVFKIPADAELGVIKRIIFLSQSTDCDVWLSLTDEQTITSANTIYAYTGANLGFMSPPLSADYYNPSGETGSFLYLTISNTTTNITSWTIIIIYER